MTRDRNNSSYPVRRHYDSLRNFVGDNAVFEAGEILCASSKNNDVYDITIVADGKRKFNALYREYTNHVPDDDPKDVDPALDGCKAITCGLSRYFYKEENGKKELVAQQVYDGGFLIFYPEGTSISGDIPANSVGTEQIEDKSIMLEDLNEEVTDQMAERVTQEDLDNFNV